MNYLDTSALIKRFVAERGSGLVDALVAAGQPIATAKIAYAEVYSGLARKRREGHLPEAKYLSACRLFEAEWPRLRCDSCRVSSRTASLAGAATGAIISGVRQTSSDASPHVRACSPPIEEIRAIVRSLTPPPDADGPAEDLPLGPGGLGFDSVRLVELLLACESRFHCSFPAELLAEPLTIARLAAHAARARSLAP
jgi:acyl carrier protein